MAVPQLGSRAMPVVVANRVCGSRHGVPRVRSAVRARAARSSASKESAGPSARQSTNAQASTSRSSGKSGAEGIDIVWAKNSSRVTSTESGLWPSLIIVAAAGAIVGAKVSRWFAPVYSQSRARLQKLRNSVRSSPWVGFMGDEEDLAPPGGVETVEWLNMAIRKVWRVYMRQIERWLERVLRRAIVRAIARKNKNLTRANQVGFKLKKVQLTDLKLDYEPPVVRSIESRSESRRDSDISVVARVRYTGGMKLLFNIDLALSVSESTAFDATAVAAAAMSAAQNVGQGLHGSEGVSFGLDGSMDTFPPSPDFPTLSPPAQDFKTKFSHVDAAVGAASSKPMGMVDVGGRDTALAPSSLSRPLSIRIPIQVYDMDIESDMQMKVRLAPLPPYIGRLSLAFVTPPEIGVQLAPYRRAELMRLPMLEPFLTKFITEDLPNLMLLPRTLNIEVPPSIFAVAEQAIGRENVRKTVLASVLGEKTTDEVIKAAMAGAATEQERTPGEAIVNATRVLSKPWTRGGVVLPKKFQGELLVTLHSAKQLAVYEGLPGIYTASSPFCTLRLNEQVASSKKFGAGKGSGFLRKRPSAKATDPVWNQDFQFLVQDAHKAELILEVKDSHLTGRPEIGLAVLQVKDLEPGMPTQCWLPLSPPRSAPGAATTGEVLVECTYKGFVEGGGFEPEPVSDEPDTIERQGEIITDVASAAAASSKAGIVSMMAARAEAVTRAASMRISKFTSGRSTPPFPTAKTAAAEVISQSSVNRKAGDRFTEEEVTQLAEMVASGQDEASVEKMVSELRERLERDEEAGERRERKWVARSDRPWLQLVSFMLGVSIFLLVLIANRLDYFIGPH